MDIEKLELEIDLINKRLTTVYSRPVGCCKKVKSVILAHASSKKDQPTLRLTYNEVQDIGKELIHESMYDYLTYLNRKTFNDVLHRLMTKKMIESPILMFRSKSVEQCIRILKEWTTKSSFWLRPLIGSFGRSTLMRP